MTAQLVVDNKVVASPRIIAKLNEMATVTQGSKENPARDFYFGVLCSDSKNDKLDDGILLKIQLESHRANGEAHFATNVVVRPGVESTFPVANNTVLKISAERL